MTVNETLEALLKSYRRYYDIKTEDAAQPFAAEAAFHTHDEQYFLVKSARLAEADSHEYVFFAAGDSMGETQVKEFADRAWEEGLSRVRPHHNHRSTDVVLILLAEHFDKEAKEYITDLKRSKSYCFSLQGFSDFYVVAMETSTGELSCNKRGRKLKELFRNIK